MYKVQTLSESDIARCPANLQQVYEQLKSISKNFKSFLYTGKVKELDEMLFGKISAALADVPKNDKAADTEGNADTVPPAPKPKKEPKPKAEKPAKAPKPKKEPKPKAEKPAKAPKPKKEPKPKAEKPAKTPRPRKAAAGKTPKPSPDRASTVFVGKLPVELTFVKRYLRMHKKTVSRNKEIKNFLIAIEKANAEGAFSVKTSKYAKEVKHVYEELSKLYKSKGSDSFVFELDNADLPIVRKFRYLIEITKVDHAVTVFKKYLTMLTRGTTKAKANGLLDLIDTYVADGRLKAANPHMPLVDKVRRQLKAYVDRDAELAVPHATLQGLAGVLNINIVHGDNAKRKPAKR